jgi:hypothetical protein
MIYHRKYSAKLEIITYGQRTRRLRKLPFMLNNEGRTSQIKMGFIGRMVIMDLLS